MGTSFYPSGPSEGNRNQIIIGNLDGPHTASPTLVSKTKQHILVRFIAETIAVAAISALTYYLRFDDGSIFKHYFRLFKCELFSTTPPQNSKPNFYVDTSVFVYLLFAAPLGSILVGESIRWALGGASAKIIFISSFPIGQFPRRLIRFSGCFYFGFLLTSTMTDMLGCLINRPTPMFFTDCFKSPNMCVNNQWVNISDCTSLSDSVETYFRSFPNYRSSVSAYAATYTAWYFHALLDFPGSYILRPMIAIGCAALSFLPSLSDLATQNAHWEDVAVGLFLGISMAIYIASMVHFFREKPDISAVQYCQLRNVVVQKVSSSDRNIRETLCQEDLTPEPDMNSSSNYIPRIQAINIGVHSNPKQAFELLGDHSNGGSNKTVLHSISQDDSSWMNNARHRQQQSSQTHQLPINGSSQQRPSTGYYKPAHDHQPIRAYGF